MLLLNKIEKEKIIAREAHSETEEMSQLHRKIYNEDDSFSLLISGQVDGVLRIAGNRTK